MSPDLSGRIALVTGATSGFGLATAEAFVRAGARVVATGRRAERLEVLAAAHPGEVHAVALDLQDRAAIAPFVQGLPAGFSEIDVLVNNAGLALGLEPAHRASLEQWDTMIETNCRALAALTRAVLPGMVARNRGHVVAVGSVAADYPYPGGNVYGATKAFVAQFMRNLKADLLGTAVRVTNIAPGMAGDTEFSLVRFGGDAARAAKVYEGVTPLGPEDIAEAILWAVTLPPHVNVNEIELMPVQQGFSPFTYARRTG